MGRVFTDTGDEEETVIEELSGVDEVDALVLGVGTLQHRCLEGQVRTAVSSDSEADVAAVGRILVHEVVPVRAVGGSVAGAFIVLLLKRIAEEEIVSGGQPAAVLEDTEIPVQLVAVLDPVGFFVARVPVVLEDGVFNRDEHVVGGAVDDLAGHDGVHVLLGPRIVRIGGDAAKDVPRVELDVGEVDATAVVHVVRDTDFNKGVAVPGFGVEVGVRTRPAEGADILVRELEEAVGLEAVGLEDRNALKGRGADALEADGVLVLAAVFPVQGDLHALGRLPLDDRGNKPLFRGVQVRPVVVVLVGVGQAVSEAVDDRAGGVDRGPHVVVGSIPDVHLVLEFGQGGLGDVVHDTAEVAHTVEQGARTADHFNTVDVDRVRRMLAAEAVAQRVVEDETADLEGGFSLVAGGPFGIVHPAEVVEGAVGVILGLQKQAGTVLEGVPQVGGAGVLDELRGHDLDGQRDVLDRHVDAGTGNGVRGVVALVLFRAHFEGR